MDALTQQLCTWLGRLDDRPLPEPVTHEVKRRVLDTIGVAVAGWESEPSRISREQALEVHVREGGATVWGTRHKTAPALAAFANGTQARYLDYNDTYLSLEPAHPSDNIPACLAVGEAAGMDGRRVIAAIAAAYEIQCRLCDAASIRNKGWDHVVYGAISAAAATGWLWGLRDEVLGHAISLGVVSNLALRQTRVGQLSHWKASAFANAARNAIFGADLARRGMIGPVICLNMPIAPVNTSAGPINPRRARSAPKIALRAALANAEAFQCESCPTRVWRKARFETTPSEMA